MCDVIQVGRSGYYHWLNASPSSRKYETEKIAGLIRTIFTNSRYAYGTRRIKKALAKEGWMVSGAVLRNVRPAATSLQ